jgi:hypothetical protein
MIEPAVQGIGTSFPLLYAALSLIGGWVGGFVGTYFNKKGENLATKQDIAEITQTTKDIEAKISSEYWVRQRNFDMKREAAFELLRQAASFQQSVVGLLSFWRTMYKTPGAMAVPNPEAAVGLNQHKNATGTFWQAKFVAGLLLPEKVISQAEKVERAGREVVDLIQMPDASEDECSKRILAMRQAQIELSRMVREDLLKP